MNSFQQKIWSFLIHQITDGSYTLGYKLPTEKELGIKFSTNRLNAHYVIRCLENLGIVTRNKRGGTLVARLPGTIESKRLLNTTSNRVFVLNHTPESYLHLRWDDSIHKILRTELKKSEIELDYLDMSGISNYEEYCREIEQLLNEGAGALVIISGPGGDDIVSQHPELLFKFHDNVFIFESGVRSWDTWNYNTVGPNNFNDGVMAVEHIVERGCGNLAFVSEYPPEYSFWQMTRWQGAQHGLLRMEKGKRKIQYTLFKDISPELLKGAGIIATNDQMAVRIIDFGRQVGLIEGDDYKLVSFDNDKRFSQYGISSFAPDLEVIGKSLAAMVSEVFFSPENNQIKTVKINSKLIQGKTT